MATDGRARRLIGAAPEMLASALAGAAPMARLLHALGVHDLPVLDGILRSVSVLVSFLLSWLVFGWMIARLPRDPVNFHSAVRAALLAAIGFEVFKLVASIYLKSVLHSPAGATFGRGWDGSRRR